MNNNCSPVHMKLVVQEDSLHDGALKVLQMIRPKWRQEEIKFKLFTDGYTNKLLGCSLADEPDDVILVRVYGQNTDLLIDRKAETRNIRTLHEYGYAPRLYATFHNGLAYEFVPGEILTVDTVKDPAVFPLIAAMLAAVHKVDCGPQVARVPCLWAKIRQFLDHVPKSYSDPVKQRRFDELIPSRLEIELELCLLETELSDTGSPTVFCHNDLLLANVIHDTTRHTVKFIDFEYAAYNYQAYDIGNHFAEMAGMAQVDFTRYPSREFQLDWLKLYLESYKKDSPVREDEIYRLYAQVNKFSLVTHFFWGIWALVQAQHSVIDFDFLEFSKLRLDEYFSRKKEFLALEIS